MFGCDEDHLQANSHFMHATFANELGDNALTVLSRFDAGVYEHFHPSPPGYLHVTVIRTAAVLLRVKLQNANSRAIESLNQRGFGPR